MNAPRGIWLGDLTWEEAASRFAANAVVLLPVVWSRTAGVPSHLPAKTASTIARALAQRLVERLPVVVAPLLEGEGDATSDLSRQLLRERLEQLRSRGARRLAIVDLGLGAAGQAEIVADVPVLRVPSAPADDLETSCMLAVDPRSVRMHLLPKDSGAQAFAGERMMAAAIDTASDALAALWSDLR
jgi:creatinine amidohydrolase/Fe(II)-dependent formamide hydrolase-like protein